MSQCHDVYEPSGFSAAETGREVPQRGPHACEFVSRLHGRVHVLRVVGSLDWTTQGRFAELVQQQCREPILIVDLTAGRIDAAGTGALLLASGLARDRQQQLVFVATDPLQVSVMISTGLNVVAPIVSSEQEAVTWCERHGIPACAPAEETTLVRD